MPVIRKLAAILSVDVVSYGLLMGGDEEGTLTRLRAHQRSIVDHKLREYDGRIVKTTGDGMLVEFASVVDAVRCAVDIQRDMVEANAHLDPDKRIDFRVGINVGDIIISDNGIGFGPEYKEKIFGLFQRLHGQGEYNGTGIGLSICKKIVENHHGFIRAFGGEGNGATFNIYIPIL